jgi:hypothetical protein
MPEIIGSIIAAIKAISGIFQFADKFLHKQLPYKAKYLRRRRRAFSLAI